MAYCFNDDKTKKEFSSLFKTFTFQGSLGETIEAHDTLDFMTRSQGLNAVKVLGITRLQKASMDAARIQGWSVSCSGGEITVSIEFYNDSSTNITNGYVTIEVVYI